MNQVSLLLVFSLFYIKIAAQSINVYGSLFGLSSSDQKVNFIQNNDKIEFQKYENMNIEFAFGTSIQKQNKFSYLELTVFYREQYNQNINYVMQFISTTKSPFKNTYGFRIGKGMKFKKNKNFTLAASVFFHGSDRQAGINGESIALYNYLDNDQKKTFIGYHELPQEINLALGLRLGVEYYISKRLFINLNFDFSGNFKRINDSSKSISTNLNSENEIISQTIVINDTKRNDFNTRFLITSFSIGFNIWKSRHQHY